MFHSLKSTLWKFIPIERNRRAKRAAKTGAKVEEIVLSIENSGCFVIGLLTSAENSGINFTWYGSEAHMAFTLWFHNVRFID